MSLKSHLREVALLSSMISVAGAAHAIPVIDQSNLPPVGGLNQRDLLWQQQVTGGITGKLAGIVLYNNASYGPDTAVVSIGTGAPAGGRSFAYTTGALTLLPTGTYFDVSAANLFLNTGDIFTIGVSGGTVSCCTLSSTATPYSGGHLFMDGSFDDSAAYGIWLTFQTYVDNGAIAPGAVPEPATFLLIGGGMAGLIAARKRKRKV